MIWVGCLAGAMPSLQSFAQDPCDFGALGAGNLSPWGEEGAELHGASVGSASEPGYAAFLEADRERVGVACRQERECVAHPGLVADTCDILTLEGGEEL